MARVRTVGIIPSHFHPRYRSAPGEIAARMFPDLAQENDLAVADWRRQAFNNDLRYVDHVLRNGVVPEEPPAPPRPRTTQADLARAIYSDLVQEREWDAYREKYARWQEDLMRPWGFVRKGK